MILATVRIFDEWKIREISDNQLSEAQAWAKGIVNQLKESYPHGSFPVIFYHCKDGEWIKTIEN